MKKIRYLKICGALSLVCAMGLALADPVSAVDIEPDKSLEIIPAADTEFAEDINKQEGAKAIIYDVYKVADAEQHDQYDTIVFKLPEGVTFTNSEDGTDYDISTLKGMANITAASWDDMAQQAGQIVRDELGAAAQTFEKMDKLESMPAGLYMLIAHGDMDPYFDTVKDAEGNERLVTYFDTPMYRYSFMPVFVSLPSTGDVDGTMIKTDGEWTNDVKITLKPERDFRMRSLKIKKDLESWEDSSPVSFVFDIVATMEGQGKPVYANTVGMTFSTAEVQSVVLKDVVPVNAVVKIKEVYSGAGYDISEGTPGEYTITVLPADEEDSPIEFEFTNKYNKDSRNGYGIENHFERVEGADGNLTWDFDNEMKWHDSGEE